MWIKINNESLYPKSYFNILLFKEIVIKGIVVSNSIQANYLKRGKYKPNVISTLKTSIEQIALDNVEQHNALKENNRLKDSHTAIKNEAVITDKPILKRYCLS